MAQFIDTNRGGENLHFEGYIYTKIRDVANDFQFWNARLVAHQEPLQREGVWL